MQLAGGQRQGGLNSALQVEHRPPQVVQDKTATRVTSAEMRDREMRIDDTIELENSQQLRYGHVQLFLALLVPKVESNGVHRSWLGCCNCFRPHVVASSG